MGNLAVWFVSSSIVLLCMNVRQFTAGAKLEGSSDASIFGPFTIVTNSIDKCQMPGPIDTERLCTDDVAAYKIDGDKEELRGTIVVPKDIANLGGQLEVNIWRDGAYKSLISKKFKNACSKGFGIFVKKFITVDQNCMVKQGNYTVKILNPDKLFKNLVGDSFFYAKMIVNVALYSSKGLVQCVKLNIESKPMPKKA